MKNILPILLMVSLLSACAPIYVPTMVHTPLFKEKGDLSGSVNTGVNSFEWHAAGAISDNFALMGSGSWTNWKNDADGSIIRRGGSFEVAPGLYKHFNSGFVMESFAGLGMGNIRSGGSGNSNFRFQGSFTKYFIQPGIGFQNQFADFALHMRVTSVHLREYGNFHSFIEPVFTMRLGFEHVKFSWQSGISIPTTIPDYDYNPFIFNMGIFIDIRKSYRKKETNSTEW